MSYVDHQPERYSYSRRTFGHNCKEQMAASEEASVWRQVRFTGDAACPARSGHAALFCASQRSMLVLGGHNETALDDIWRFSLDEQRWQQVTAATENAKTCACELVSMLI